jgi:hypothetical protein
MTNDGAKSLIGKILFVIGVIIVLIVLAFLIIRFVPKIFSGLANVGSSITGVLGKNEIAVTTSDTSLSNGEKFTVGWEFNTGRTGVYSITNECVENVEVDIETPNGTRRLICDNPFTLGSENGSVSLIANLNKDNSFADVPIVVNFTENGSDTPLAKGSVIVTIQNGDPNAGTFGDSNATISTDAVEMLDDDSKKEEVKKPSTGAQTVIPATQSPVATAPADLSISNVVASGNQVAFTVSNIGGQRTGNWNFNYTTPTNPKENLSSPLQASLSRGQSIRYTLTFGVKASGNQNVVIQLDPTNSISELSETNNIGTVTLSGNAIGGGNNGGSYDSNDDADFVINNLEVGRLSGSRFTEDDRADDGDDIAIQFTVKNNGGENTEDWRFEIDNLPYDNDDNYRSKEYSALRPGESMTITVEFENIDEGDYDIEVTIDSENDTREEKESNNDDSVELEVRN